MHLRVSMFRMNHPPEPTNHFDMDTDVCQCLRYPKFFEISEEDKGIIRKLHTNLGHPTAEKLARHLSEARAQRHLVDAARGYLCGICAERQKPKLTTPGNRKDPKEFNERISFDGFEWKSKGGQNFSVIHGINEATRYHLGLRSQRDIQTTIKTLHQIWFQWAGFPQQIVHDQGDELMTNEWEDLLLENGIQPIWRPPGREEELNAMDPPSRTCCTELIMNMLKLITISLMPRCCSLSERKNPCP